jgi:hypothetical protein
MFLASFYILGYLMELTIESGNEKKSKIGDSKPFTQLSPFWRKKTPPKEKEKHFAECARKP